MSRKKKRPNPFITQHCLERFRERFNYLACLDDVKDCFRTTRAPTKRERDEISRQHGSREYLRRDGTIVLMYSEATGAVFVCDVRLHQWTVVTVWKLECETVPGAADHA